MVALLHWTATYVFCFGLIVSIILSHLAITPHLLSFGSVAPSNEGAAAPANSTPAATPQIAAGETSPSGAPAEGKESAPQSSDVKETPEPAAAEPKQQEQLPKQQEQLPASPLVITFEPFVWSHPFLFELIIHAATVCVLPLYYGLRYLRQCLGFPKLRTMRKRLKGGRSRFGNLMAHVNEQFDDCMIEGRISSASAPVAFILLGLLTTSLLVSSYLWKLALLHASVPFCTLLSYFHLLMIPPLMVPILKEKLHGLRLLAAVLCFIGAYIFIFPEAAANPGYSLSDVLKATALSISSALTFALYLVCYRLLNPDGWMLKVVGFQNLGLLLFGMMIMTGLHFSGVESFGLPKTMYDIATIIYSSISRFCILYCMNETLRWGEPLVVGTALAVAPPASYFLRTVIRPWFPLTHSKIASLSLCLSGLGIVAGYHLVRALRGQVMLSHRSFSSYRVQGSSNERKRLIVGDNYVI